GDADLGAAGDQLFLVGAVTLDLGRWALDPQQLGWKPERHAVVEVDLENLLRLAQADLRRPMAGTEGCRWLGHSSIPPVLFRVVERPRLVGQHDGNAVANREGEPGLPADQLHGLAVERQRR